MFIYEVHPPSCVHEFSLAHVEASISLILLAKVCKTYSHVHLSKLGLAYPGTWLLP